MTDDKPPRNGASHGDEGLGGPDVAVAPAGPDVAAGPAAGPKPAARLAASEARPARAPEQTSDDTDVGWGEAPESGDAHDRWLLEQRPPHWD
jgi:hypothetical protein